MKPSSPQIDGLRIGVYYRRQRPSEFNPVLHFLFPLLSTLSLV